MARGRLFIFNRSSKNFKILTKKDELDLNILKEFKISSKINNYPNELSGGEYQRVILATTFLNNSDLMIVDEPLTGVDIDLKYKILQRLYSYLYKNDKSLLLVSHEIDILLLLCDKIIFVDGKSKNNTTEILLKNKPVIKTLNDLVENDFFRKKRNEIMSLICQK